ncbi:hypothetical protein ACPPVS_03350 [Cellulomonas sp. McL0617]|uniref:hypothetical protein n=1 Tax=Cellulomonas sp. McL0617 TaxID=3415675 RepID=UPI003CE94B31
MFRRRTNVDDPSPSAGFGLRAQALSLDPAAIGLSPGSGGPMWGIAMDTAMSGSDWFTLVALVDGTVSLYTSSGSGIIGGGAHASVRAASDALLVLVGERLDFFAPTTSDDLPQDGQVVIRVLTFGGQRSISAPERELGGGRHAASSIFYAAHAVIAQLRVVTQPR